ncbi:hypothetical protein FN846DRAFT_564679 [Sphaerosporella brunnea]|uniref:Uncharacterized protein n=1 Tax=Sphaerosporella brunnea TaxID=1250544 RepID=A0A5J5FBA2_9PEZI|nr:hypothetical protein FN846DRAFT_564679 [Sphaerosporella brunnea]
MSMTTAPVGSASLQQYQAQLQANQAALGQQLLLPQQRPLQQQSQLHQQSLSVSIATQQQQQLMNKAMEKHSELELDKKRVTLLLEINAELLREVLNVQPKLKSPEEAKNDPVFRECMRRLQQNLAYLAAIADRSHKPASLIPVCPGVLQPPPDMPLLEGLYKRLQELYPGINPSNPPQQHQQNAQLAPSRSGQNASPKSQITQGAPNSITPSNHGSPPRDNSLASPPPPQMPSHQSPPPQPVMQGMQLPQHQHPPPPPTPQQQQQQQQMMYQNHMHSQSPPIQDPRMHQQAQAQHYAQLQQQRQFMMQQQQQQQQRAVQQQQQQQQQAQPQIQHLQSHMTGPMGIPTTMGMGVSGPGMNGMPVSMAPQQAMNPGMMGAGPGMVMAGGMGMNSYGGMQMSSAGPMVGAMGAMAPMNSMGQVPMGHMGMGNMAMGMGGMQPGGGFTDMNHPMWNQGWGP